MAAHLHVHVFLVTSVKTFSLKLTFEVLELGLPASTSQGQNSSRGRHGGTPWRRVGAEPLRRAKARRQGGCWRVSSVEPLRRGKHASANDAPVHTMTEQQSRDPKQELGPFPFLGGHHRF